MLKKGLGISRNRISSYSQAKQNLHKKKNRFKYISKDDEPLTENEMSVNNEELLSDDTRNSESSEKSYEYHTGCVQICEQIKDLLQKVNNISTQFAKEEKRMTVEAKARYSSVKQSETKKLDENICKLSKEAVQHILLSEKHLNVIRGMKGKNLMEEKYYRNMEMSLALEIREASKELRKHEKQYFDRLKTWENSTVNNAIHMNTEDREKMRSELDTFEMEEQRQEQKDERSEQIQELVRSINQLTTVYKELNDLVIHQGSLIDRIDYYTDETYQCMQRGNEHLRGADRKAHSECAGKCIYVLMAAVLVLAIILGFKYSSKD